MRSIGSSPLDSNVMVSSRSGVSGRSDLMAAPPPPTPAKTRPFSSPVSSSSSPSLAIRGKTQSSLHDFSSFPVLKTWGNQRILRFVRLKGSADLNGESLGRDSDRVLGFEEMNKRKRLGGEEDDEFDRIRAKLMVHFREAAGKIELAVPTVPENESPAEMPWSMRTRRGSYGRLTKSRNPNSPPRDSTPAERSTRPRSEEEDGRKEKKRCKFSVTLTKEEIDEDIYSLTGKRASRRPKKRPRALKKQLDQLFPGFYSSEVTPELYEVRETPPMPTES